MDGGVFADNTVLGLDIDRADNIRINGTRFVGVSDSFKALLASEDAPVTCAQDAEEKIIGLELHTWKDGESRDDTALVNVTFESYGEELPCANSVPIAFDDNFKGGFFDYTTWMTDVTFTKDSSSYVDFCSPNAVGVKDVYVTDMDGSLVPKTSGEMLVSSKTQRDEVSTLVGRESSSLSFIDDDRCTDVPKHCYKYCDGVCYQTVRFDVDASARSLPYTLQICSKSSPGTCINTDGHRRRAPRSDFHWSTRPLMFDAHLPVGEYSAVFVDDNGKHVWPNYAYGFSKSPMCLKGGTGSVELEVPDVTIDECRELVKNGMIDSDDATPTDAMWPWLHRRGAIELAVGEGTGGSDAIKSNLKLKTAGNIIQNLDNRCFRLLKDRKLELQASLRYVDGEGNTVPCGADGPGCPDIGICVGDKDWRTVASVPANAGADADGYQIVTGTMTVTDDMVGAGQIFFFVRGQNKKLHLYLDNASMKLVDGWNESDEDAVRENVPPVVALNTWEDPADVELDIEEESDEAEDAASYPGENDDEDDTPTDTADDEDGETEDNEDATPTDTADDADGETEGNEDATAADTEDNEKTEDNGDATAADTEDNEKTEDNEDGTPTDAEDEDGETEDNEDATPTDTEDGADGETEDNKDATPTDTVDDEEGETEDDEDGETEDNEDDAPTDTGDDADGETEDNEDATPADTEDKDDVSSEKTDDEDNEKQDDSPTAQEDDEEIESAEDDIEKDDSAMESDAGTVTAFGNSKTDESSGWRRSCLSLVCVAATFVFALSNWL